MTVRGYPGWSQRAHLRRDRVAAAQETATGDLVVRVYGRRSGPAPGLRRGRRRGARHDLGRARPEVEPQVSQPTVAIEVDLAKAQKYGLRPGDVRRETSTLVSGLTVGNLYEQQEIFDVVVWGGQATRPSVGSSEDPVDRHPLGRPRAASATSPTSGSLPTRCPSPTTPSPAAST